MTGRTANMILITGGTGQSGTEIVRQLAATGTRFRALARNPAKAGAIRIGGVEIVQGDMGDNRSLAPALTGVDRLLLNSAPDASFVESQMNVIDAAKQAGVRHVVKFSAMTADPNSPSTFPRMHGQVEQHLRQSGLAWTLLRPTFFMQNWLGLSGMVKQGTVFQPAGNGKSAPVDLRDIAAVAVKTLTEAGHEGKVYDITGPQLLTYAEVAQILSEVSGHPVKYQDIPPAAAKPAMVAMGIPEFAADAINELMDQLRAGQYERQTSVVRDVAKKEPIRFMQFAREHLAAWK
jgi:uncharacterized protein YbjT (DUF2867 family)